MRSFFCPLVCSVGVFFCICLDLAGPGPLYAGRLADVRATVYCVPVREGIVTKTITAYGTVIPSPGAVKVLSLPYQARIAEIYVNEGQVVRRGEPLLKIAPGPDALLAFKEARLEYEGAKKELGFIDQRFSLGLATNQEVAAAKKTLDQAAARLKHLEDQGVGAERLIRVPVNGPAEWTVNRVIAGRDAVVQPDSFLVEIVAQNGLEVRLGVEPEDASLVKTGQSVAVSFVNRADARPIVGRVRAVSKMVNPSTRLLDVFVSLPSSLGVMLNEYVRGEIRLFSRKGLLVPRDAVIPEDKAFVLFTVKGGLAKKHIVKVGLENDGEVEVMAGDILKGDMAVVLGNYELKDGMAVTVKEAAGSVPMTIPGDRGIK
ncbi:efflux RND transporter periplasmic adaptor subunit [Dissulfurimicrobium hydrothermale]|uniref:efflux RND transporter periplasmic adaptor subunit n=1 Tax=Dissulfurimicrobium hydrothermale TaxID=1750598 RepID=UPI001EDB8DD4|nr:efflux RND transporter periplasmic adaptor subunit [Dissulfurimicrobium hydrothermale]UKL13702.1 efflux RND transporter periplasmic adaptor subunit [Dissulfurimicrobium hydrothermale]